MTDEHGVTRYVDDYERERELKARLAEACGAVGWVGDEGTEQDRGRRTEDGGEGNRDIGGRTEDQDGTVRNGGPYEGAHPVGTTDLSGAIGNNGITGVVDHIVWTSPPEYEPPKDAEEFRMRGLAARMKQASEPVVQDEAQEKEAGPKAQPTGIEPDSRNEAEDVRQNEAIAIRLTAQGDRTNQTIEPEPVFQHEAEDIEQNEAGGETVKDEGGRMNRNVETEPDLAKETTDI